MTCAPLPRWLGLDQAALHVSMWDIAKSVLIFLGIPLLAGFLTRTFGERARGREWYETTFLPRIGPGGALRAAVHDRAAVRAAVSRSTS